MKLLIPITLSLLLSLSTAYSQTSSFQITKLSAEQGDAAAQYNLGNMYRRGEGVPLNVVEAVKWYRLAAEQGYANAQFNLGFAYANGYGVPQNAAEAAKWYRLAAEQGYAIAQLNLGGMYATGRGVPQDYLAAYVWFSVAATQGNENAKTNRDRVVGILKPEQRARGKELATRCIESGSKDCE